MISALRAGGDVNSVAAAVVWVGDRIALNGDDVVARAVGLSAAYEPDPLAIGVLDRVAGDGHRRGAVTEPSGVDADAAAVAVCLVDLVVRDDAGERANA